MNFDDWYVVINHKYKNSDDTEALRLLRTCWFTAQAEQREADAHICERYMHGDGELNEYWLHGMVAAIRNQS